SPEVASFATVGAIALHGFRLAETQLGERVVVIGLGLIGLLATQICRAAGVRVLGIDPDPHRRALALDLGAEVVAGASADEAADAVQAWTDGWGADAALVAASSEGSGPLEVAAAVTRDRGTVVAIGAFGMDVPRRPFYMKELQLRVSRSYGPGRYDPSYEEGGVDYPIGHVRWTEGRNLSALVELMASGDVTPDVLISHRFPIGEAEEAYQLISDGNEPVLGVVLTYEQSDGAGNVDDGAGADPGRTITMPTSAKRNRSADAPDSQDRFGLGLLGAGQFATGILLPAIQQSKGFRAIGVCSSGGLSGKHAAEKFGFRYATTEETQVLGDDAVALVAIATRHGSHGGQVVRSLEAGKHVFVEKPLCLTVDELAAIVRALAARPDQQLTVGFNRRFAPLAQYLRAFREDAGEPALITYRVNAGALPKDHWVHDPDVGGGRILGEVCHFVDFASYVAGAHPSRVTATGVRDRGRYRDDNVQIGLEFEDGSSASISYAASGDRVMGKERCEVFAGSGAALLDDFRIVEIARGGKVKKHRSRLRQDKGHEAEWTALATALRAKEPAIPRESLVGTTLATLAAVRALREGAPVDVDTLGFIEAASE
ncbi:MAG: bi-domain-containing oxidoreductase, partial [Gemmatimonadota bacterium]|nr:bi-domain-containing oxidoreductase [Gemmatimonadota bacterium]